VGGWRRWWFGDIASVFAPAVDRGAGHPPTRRSARWLIGIGLFLTLFGAIGVAGEFGAQLERQDATVLGRYTSHLYLRTSTGDFHKVKFRLEDGTSKMITNLPLYEAIGPNHVGMRVQVDVDPKTDLIDAVYVSGHRYALGKLSAAKVITILFTLLGVFVLLRGIGRYRRYRLTRSAQPGGPVEG